MATYLERRIPEQFIQTINNTGGSVQVFTEIANNDEVTLLQINNTSTTSQTIYLGFGQPAVVGINPLGPGFTWLEGMDNEARPWGGKVNAIASADGATISVQRRIRPRVI